MTDPQVISLGCRLNAHEGERMRGLARAAGLSGAVVVNSCAVTNEAVRQTRQTIRRARRDNPGARIIVTGCAAQIDPDAFASMGEVDAVLGNAEKLNAGDWRALADGETAVRVNDIMSVRETAGHLADGYGERARAFLEVQTGCDHRCTFCIIPYGRGNSRSVPFADVVDGAHRLTQGGCREIVLTGVDMTSYGADLSGKPTLGALACAILDAAPDLLRLRFSSIDVAEIDDTLFDLIVSEPRIAPHLHLSLQAGDDLILKRMKRRHTRADAIEFCSSVRTARPEVAFGADFIAGFPTETEEMFQQTLGLVDEAGLQFLHVFPFSPRVGTPAARMPQVDRGAIKERAAHLRAKGDEAEARFLETLVGKTFEAIVESGGRARLGNFAQVRLQSPAGAAGDAVRLFIEAREGQMLAGTPLSARQN